MGRNLAYISLFIKYPQQKSSFRNNNKFILFSPEARCGYTHPYIWVINLFFDKKNLYMGVFLV